MELKTFDITRDTGLGNVLLDCGVTSAIRTDLKKYSEELRREIAGNINKEIQLRYNRDIVSCVNNWHFFSLFLLIFFCVSAILLQISDLYFFFYSVLFSFVFPYRMSITVFRKLKYKKPRSRETVLVSCILEDSSLDTYLSRHDLSIKDSQFIRSLFFCLKEKNNNVKVLLSSHNFLSKVVLIVGFENSFAMINVFDKVDTP